MCAFAGKAVADDAATHALGYQVVNRMHAKTHAVLQVGGKEGVEDLLAPLGTHPRAIVAVIDGQQVAVGAGIDNDHAVPALGKTMMQRVADQI